VVGAHLENRISKTNINPSFECQEKEKHFTFTVEKSGAADLYLGFDVFFFVGGIGSERDVG